MSYVGNMIIILFLCVLLAPTTALTGSHSLWMLATYMKGEPYSEISITFMLDDITVGHYNSKTERYIARHNTTNEDELTWNTFYVARHDLHTFFVRKLKFKNHTESPQLYQMMSHCELQGNNKPGQMVSKIAFSGSTTDEMSIYENKFTYQSQKEMPSLALELIKWRHESVSYPTCISTLRNYLKMRQTQVNRKVKPKVRLFQKANSDSGGFRVNCLATGFYPRHINLTLLRDGQPVSENEVTGGDLLPNGDGTYQMRKSLEIRAEERQKHKYTCSAKHLSLDNKLIVTFDFDPGEPFKSVIPSVLIILSLVLVFITGVVIYKCRKRRAVSSKRDYISASTSEESTGSTVTQPQQEAT
ncbi:major histocompatibility complex class I LJA precursor [Danio rerio]|uniref:Major histocompatibility complex class I LJA n=1 Tax=Danio rerio TaxID=7955 RepID=X1WF83_DANRE|nr:major histocompatibility complex class I LJA precursor [Danio rerio]|eukprot:NP_001314847.1 major histocompatibility complex class I LJA precursor [Danio rerio]